MLRTFLRCLLAIQALGCGISSSALWAADEKSLQSQPVEALIDGKLVPLVGEEFRVPASHKSVSFRVGRPATDLADGFRRFTYQLEGIDAKWREMPSEMCLTVRFLDAAGDQVGQQIFQVSGQSAGWHGVLEDSSFTPHVETVRVPEKGAFVTVAISSSGPPTAMGIYAVQGLKVVRADGAGEKTVLEANVASDRLDAAPVGWARSGTKPSMARLFETLSGYGFGILDDDPNTHAEWNLTKAAAPRVEPGETLTVRWSELYDIGTGNRFEVNYGQLNAGTYFFLSKPLAPDGRSLQPARKIRFVVLQPFWRSPWVWLIGSTALSFLVWLIGRAIIGARIRQHLAGMERERIIERERLRIAQDLHDDLGARLTHISLVSGLAENDPQSAASRESFQRISGMARELVAALYQTVWAVNPENDHLEALVNYLGQLTESLCEAAGIRGRIHTCAVPKDRRVTSEIRHEITMAVKEAVHNAIKHAAAAEISLRTEFNDSRLTVIIADNGRGFDPTTAQAGNGLANMRRRAEAVGGSFSIESSVQSGTRIQFELPIPESAKQPPDFTSPDR